MKEFGNTDGIKMIPIVVTSHERKLEGEWTLEITDLEIEVDPNLAETLNQLLIRNVDETRND